MQTAHNDSIEISERFHFQHPVFRFPFSVFRGPVLAAENGIIQLRWTARLGP
jgi:hypothetical protein